VTILEIIKRSTDFFAKKGVESPRLQIELLLAHVLQMPRMKLYLNFERVLTEPELEKVRALVKRRGNREPLQHITGSANFHGLEFNVTPHVLVPRPETELLAEKAWLFLQSLGGSPVALDFGTGTGCLPITLAVKCPAAILHALDISPAALQMARANAERHQVASRLTFHQGDGFAALPHGLAFELIVSNPPYIASAEIETLDPEVRDFDPRTALDGGTDGLDFYRRLARESAAWLRPGGKLMLEFGDGQGEAIRDLLTAASWRVESLEKDLSGRERVCVASRPIV
jgi:release factor glutamine methyltransferase